MNIRINASILPLLTIFLTVNSTAAEISKADIEQWLGEDITVDAPIAGSVVDAANIATLYPWIPPGLRDEFDFDEVSIEIQQTMDYPGHTSYQQASDQYAGQATLGADGQLENFVAGRPFSDEQINSGSADKAGFMIAWNQIHRWQFTGYKVEELTMTYINNVPGSAPLDADHGLLGGGNQTRRLSQFYHRVYLSKLAWLGDQQYRMDVPDSDTRYFKDYISFIAPFDVKGTSFVVERYLDPTADDQVNIYSPTERRVRRFSAKERADSFMGSEGTMDDFEGFSGRVLDYTWTYLGGRDLLYVADSRDGTPQGFGPFSRLPYDRWQVRKCHVVEVKSVWDAHPYGSRLLFIDAQTYSVALSLVIDHSDMLWKTFQTVYRGPLAQSDAEAPMGETVQGWRGQFNVDRKTNNSTVVQSVTPTEHPALKPSQIKRVFSVSNLTSGR